MDSYTSEAIDFFVLVLTSGMIAVAALAVASAFAFFVAFVLLRERAAAGAVAPVGGPAAIPRTEVRPAHSTTYAAGTPAAVAG